MTSDALERGLLAAHEAGDTGTLSGLYARAADRAEADGDRARACFFLTQAWIFSLECGAETAPALKARLVAQGRDK